MLDKINKAFKFIPRAKFLPDDVKDQANHDVPLPIGFNQTNSQPSTVKQLLAWLEPQEGEVILDVGSGSGWTTALLANLVGEAGKVYAVERITELVDFGRHNCRNLRVPNAYFYEAGEEIGLPKFALYDRILVNASANSLPQGLIRQLKVGGRLVIPIRYSVFVINKKSDDNYTTTEHPGFAFVPLIID